MMDASHVSIRDLARSIIADGKVLPVVIFFGLSPKAKEMISSLSRLRESVLLRQLWIDNGDKALRTIAERKAQNTSLGVEDVVELIWIPANAELQSLQAHFLSGDISFGEVDKMFRVFKDNQKYDDLANEIRLFTLRGGSPAQTTEELINLRIEQIQQYYKLQRCVEAAKIILDFKTFLGLKGDFKLVEHLSNQVRLSFTFHTVSYYPIFLNNVKEVQCSIGKFLIPLTRCKVIDAFSACFELKMKG